MQQKKVQMSVRTGQGHVVVFDWEAEYANTILSEQDNVQQGIHDFRASRIYSLHWMKRSDYWFKKKKPP